MKQNSGGAASFFGSPDDAARAEEWTQTSEAAFEQTCVRQICKKFDVDPRCLANIAGKPEDSPITFGLFDLAFRGFPVRLSTRRLRAKGDSDKRTISKKGFHELRPLELFGAELVKTQIFRSWEDMLDDQVRDHRAAGLVFGCVNTPFVIHNFVWDLSAIGTRLVRVAQSGNIEFVIETLKQLGESIGTYGWSSI